MNARINLLQVAPGILQTMFGLEEHVRPRASTTGVPDDVYDRVRQQFSEDELAHLSLAVAAINGWNRLNVAARTVPGDYVAGSLAKVQAAG